MLFGILGAILLGNMLAGKGMNRAGDRTIAKRQGWGFIRASYGSTIKK